MVKEKGECEGTLRVRDAVPVEAVGAPHQDVDNPGRHPLLK